MPQLIRPDLYGGHHPYSYYKLFKEEQLEAMIEELYRSINSIIDYLESEENL